MIWLFPPLVKQQITAQFKRAARIPIVKAYRNLMLLSQALATLTGMPMGPSIRGVPVQKEGAICTSRRILNLKAASSMSARAKLARNLSPLLHTCLETQGSDNGSLRLSGRALDTLDNIHGYAMANGSILRGIGD